jgi:SAM-dependent MidA family methyltransferase
MTASSVATPTLTLEAHLHHALQSAGGWLPFDQFMHLALYTPGLGYYSGGLRKFGTMPEQGSDFVTAPELSPLFGQCLAEQILEALLATGTHQVWEFGAGSGQLALQILQRLANDPQAKQLAEALQYRIVDVSGSLRARQQELLQGFAAQVRWVDELPTVMQGVAIGNEDTWGWQDRPTDWLPPVEVPGVHDYLTEAHPQAEAFVRTLSQKLTRGAAFFIDYGFPEAEYYHEQRHMGTLMCHQLHKADANPLLDVGQKDITSHVNFTGVALAAQDSGAQILGYTTQARFLMNCGALQKMEQLTLPQRADAVKLLLEHEMGELFKVIGWVAPESADAYVQALGFASGDRTHTL